MPRFWLMLFYDLSRCLHLQLRFRFLAWEPVIRVTVLGYIKVTPNFGNPCISFKCIAQKLILLLDGELCDMEPAQPETLSPSQLRKCFS